MWAIAHSLVLHNLRRSQILGMALAVMILIWATVDPFVSAHDLKLGDLWPSRAALWGTIIITLVVVLQELPKEMSSRFHLILLSKPISRYDYLMGKILGLFLFSSIYVSGLVLFSFLAQFLQCEDSVDMMSNLVLPWFHYVLYLWLFCVIAGVSGAFLSEAFSLIAIAVVLACSYAVGLLPMLKDSGEVGIGLGLLLKMVYYLVPNFQYFGPSNFDTYGFVAPLYLLVYVAGYTVLVLPLALLKFERQSFM
jgi:ABC-type transport system involved in multi-copper enzyme maturation permease subunit